MGRKPKKTSVIKRFKKLFFESEAIQKPLESLFRDNLGRIVPWILTAIAILFVFPFSLRSILADLLFLSFVIWLSSKLIKATVENYGSKRFWLIAILMLPFTAICPFIVAPKPMYIAMLDTPLHSTLTILNNGDKQIGSEMSLSSMDFFRLNISKVLKKIFPIELRILTKYELPNGTYYSLPVFNTFIFNVSDPLTFPCEKNVYFPSVCVSKEISVVTSETGPISHSVAHKFSFNCGMGSVPLIDFAYTQFPDTIPWEAVHVPDRNSLSILPYVAYLDRAMEFFATGRTEDAIKTLDKAAVVAPPENLEGARVAALKYLAATLSLRGNIGNLQCLPLLRDTYKIFLESQNDARFSKNDPLANWLRELLESGYETLDWTTLFFDRTAKLDAVPHNDTAENDDKYYTDILSEKYGTQTDDEILQEIRTNNLSPAELHFIKYLVLQRCVLQAIGSSLSESASSDIIISFVKEKNRVEPIVKLIDHLLRKQDGLQPDEFTETMFSTADFLEKQLPKLPLNADDERTKQFIKMCADGNPVFKNIATLITGYENGAVTNGSWNNQRSGWWNVKYMLWFSAWSGDALEQIDKRKYPWQNFQKKTNFFDLDVSNTLSKYGEDFLIKDRNGQGDYFTPAVFVLAYYEQEFNMAGADELKQEFKDETGIPFSMYLSSLYPADDY